MKNHLFLFFFVLCFVFFPEILEAQLAQGQDNINYQSRIKRCYWHNNDDDGQEEPVFLFKAKNDINGAFNWLMTLQWNVPSGQDYSHNWTNHSPSWSSDNLNIGIITELNSSSKKFDFEYQSWEHDCSDLLVANSCVNSDDSWGGVGNIISPKSYNSSEWKTHTMNNGENNSKVQYQTTWRYTKGNWDGDALSFGSITSGTKNHDNSNRSAPSGANGNMGYTNRTQYNGLIPSHQPSPDVAYKFSLSSSKKVTISTDHTQTNFDTYIHLVRPTSNSFAHIESDDQGGSNNKSKIIRNLCPGDYIVIVEGYQSNKGDFRLSIGVSNPDISAGSISTSSTTICEGANIPNINNSSSASSQLGNITYSWEKKVGNASWLPVSGSGSSFTNAGTMPNNTVRFRRKASAGCDASVVAYSNTITFNKQNITHNKGSISLSGFNTIPPGTDPGSINSSANASASPGPASIIWQKKEGNGQWTTISGANSQSYNIPVLNETTRFRRGVQSNCGESIPSNAFSNEIVVNVYPRDGKISGYVRSNPNDPNSGVEGVTIAVEQTNNLPGSPAPQFYTTTTTGINGLYEIEDIYYGPNTGNFKVTPSKTDHEFDPVSVNLTLNEDQKNKTANFIDISTFTINGRVTQSFEGTICGLSNIKVEILQNGIPIGSPIFTDDNGNYQLVASPGSYIVRPTEASYEFSPTSLPVNVTGNMTNVDFAETTDYELSGFVRAACETPMGTAEVLVTDGCISKTVWTDNDGFYEVNNLPAREYKVRVVDFNPIPGFNKLEVLDFFNTDKVFDLKTTGDLVLDLTYHRPPVIVVSGMPDAPCMDFGNSVLEQASTYPLTIEIFEEGGTCPITAGTITVNDQISDLGNMPFTEEFTEHTLEYEMKGGHPNIVYPFLKNITISVTDTFNRSVNWTLDALVTGSRPREQNFSTQSPELPFLILRDPPGDNSYSFWEQSTTTETATRFFAQDSESINAWGNVKVGTKIGVSIFGVSTETSFWSDVTGSHQITSTNTNANEVILSITNNQSFQTSASEDFIGTEGDVFVASALAFSYAISDNILFDFNNCEPVQSKSLMLAKDGLETTAMYTEKNIREVVIPQLELLKSLSNDQIEQENYDNQISVWEQTLQLNEDLKAVATFEENVSFSAGVAFEESTTTTTTESSTIEFAMEIDDGIATELGFEIGGSGIKGGVMTNFKMETGNSETSTTINSLTTGFHLEDDDPGDQFTVNIKTDPVYKTPVFELLGGQSSCPAEEGTNARDALQLRVDNPIQAGLAPNGTATFTFFAGNISESNETRDNYFLKVKDGSNPGGALINISGSPFTDPVPLGPIDFEAESVQTVTVQRGTSPEYSFESIEFELYSDCDPSISSTIAISAFFQSPCSDITLIKPQEGWLINRNNDNEMLVRMKDYDVDNLDQVTVEYAITGSNAWTPGLVLENDDLIDSPSGTEVIWNVANLEDGKYQARLKLTCGINTVYSDRVDGTIDRIAPEVFGLPQPIDDNYAAGDEISVTFNETLDCSKFDINSVTLKRVYTDTEITAELDCYNNKLIVIPDMDLSTLAGEPIQVIINDVTDLHRNTTWGPVFWEFTVGGTIVSDDFDNDGVINALDQCEGFDDNVDADGDGMPDACDLCPDNANPAIDFDGEDDVVSGSVDLANFGTNDFTVDFWMKTTKTGWSSMVRKGNTCDASVFWEVVMNAQGKIEYYERNGSIAQLLHTNIPVNDGKWKHIAVTRNVDTLSIFVNGFMDNQKVLSNIMDLNNDQPVLIGNASCADWDFEGQLDEIRFWDYARTSSEISIAISTEIEEDTPGLTAYFNFNEGIPGEDNQSLAMVEDLTGNGFDATLENFDQTGLASNWVVGGPIQPTDEDNDGVGDYCDDFFSSVDEAMTEVGFELTNLYPNPTSNEIFINVTLPATEELKLDITDLAGRSVLRQIRFGQAGQNELQVNVDQLPIGSYIVRLIRPDGSFTVEKLMIQK